jgi:hypothetical protein
MNAKPLVPGLDPRIIYGQHCVYCGEPVKPRLFPSGKTNNLYHFVPKRTLEIAQEYHLSIREFSNWLLPACGRCNNFAGENVFLSAEDKIDFVRTRTGRYSDRYLSFPPIVAREFFEIVRPIEELLPGRAFIIPCPHRTPRSGWRIEERIIPRCDLMTHFMGLLKMELLPSPAMSPA